MLRYLAIPDVATPSALNEGLTGDGIHLHYTLPDSADDSERILVVDVARLEGVDPFSTEEVVQANSIPPEALLNTQPYHPPKPVDAAGGYVLRAENDALQVLLIHRRGEWDLPKGKREPDEPLDECALREVREEVGIDQLAILAPLPVTRHGYVRDGNYCVKTTHWFLMKTPERSFEPQEAEDIEKVRWMSWDEAVRAIGYASLRRHMQHVEPTVREILRSMSASSSAANS